ncbi:hypothetical protein R1sor_016430 [Riccia sorocarpa]|uniref:Cupin type-1 domain-containing protein n=1 Tax=Riccia sorocarpa TaxID=122646 RepID=A0ABD3HGU1_9MARC
MLEDLTCCNVPRKSLTTMMTMTMTMTMWRLQPASGQDYPQCSDPFKLFCSPAVKPATVTDSFRVLLHSDPKFTSGLSSNSSSLGIRQHVRGLSCPARARVIYVRSQYQRESKLNNEYGAKEFKVLLSQAPNHSAVEENIDSISVEIALIFKDTRLHAVTAAVVHAADPEEIRDFAPPPNGTALNADYFTFKGLRNLDVASGAFANVTPANVKGFPALSGLGVSNALVLFPPGSVNPPHTHPRGTETLFIISGTLFVGLLDTTAPIPQLFTQTLQAGDIFVFPRGLVHFQINRSGYTVKGYASFSSTFPGTVSLPRTLFKTDIDYDVLTKSFGVSDDIIKALTAT